MGEGLNAAAYRICALLESRAERLRIEQHDVGGTQVWDFGVVAHGGMAAGLTLAEICLAGRAQLALERDSPTIGTGVCVSVQLDDPVTACLGSQYAGWEIRSGDFFGMGSGPMRHLTHQESLLEELAIDEQSETAVGVLELRTLPDAAVCREIAAQCQVAQDRLVLCVARTGSLAGTVQIVARSVETALHKLHALGFDLRTIRSGWGVAPLPPLSVDDLQSLGWTNDAILYGGQVVLWVEANDDGLDELVKQVPSSASRDFGRPFAEIFREYQYDFYRIDPLLFSPAVITLVNRTSGRWFRAGQRSPEILRQSFGGQWQDE